MELSEKYKILKELGDQRTRKFGRVFLVEDKHTLLRYILKYSAFDSLEEHICERIRNEYRFNFEKQGLPQIHERSVNEKESFLVLYYKEGYTLDEYWKGIPKKKRIEKLQLLITALCPLMEELRRQGIVHCDIKPSNILVNELEDGLEVNLIDFGLAFDLKHDLDSRKILFPLGFAAPELILNKLDCIDHTTDIYALGIVIWRLFTGKLPLTHPNPSIFTNLQITHPLPEHEAIPKELFKILSRMCVKHQFSTSPNRMHPDEIKRQLTEAKKQRYQSLPEVLNDLNEIRFSSNWINKVLFGNRKQN